METMREPRMKKRQANRLLLSPQLWLIGAVLAVGASLVVDYVEAQHTADRALALRQGPPPTVVVQDFDSARHEGPAREIVIRAEARLSQAVEVTIGPDGQQQSAIILPLFPVSESGERDLAWRTDHDDRPGSIRPVQRPSPDRTRPAAAAVLLHWADRPGNDVSGLLESAVALGANGSLFDINGQRVSAGDMRLVIAGAMAAQGTTLAEDFLVLAPFVGGREAALAAPEPSGLQKALLWGGVTLAIGSVLMSIAAAHEQGRPRPPVRRRTDEQDTRNSPGETAKARSRFQTIPTQDEIYAATDAGDKDASQSKATLLQTLRTGMLRFRTRQ